LEFQIDLTTWNLIGEEQRLYACLSAQLISPLPKLDTLYAVVEQVGGDQKLLKKIRTFAGSMGELVKLRNRAIHDHRVIWFGYGKREVARVEVSAKGGLKYAPILETIDDLLALRERIGKKYDEFMQIRDYLADALPSSEERLRGRPIRKAPRKVSTETPPTESK
jgi:hypothetical protein